MIQTFVEICFILCQISNSRHVDGYHTNGTGAFAGAEETTGFLAKFTQIQTQTAAHASYITGFHITVNIIGKIRCSVFGGHFKQEAVIFCIRPVKFTGNGVCRNGILESASVVIAFQHGFDKCLVDHGHLFFTILVAEIHLLAAYNSGQFCQIIRYCPVQGNVGKRRLSSPTAGCIDTIYKGLNTLQNLLIAQIIRLYKGRQISIKGRKCLRTCPFILHGSQEINHLVAEYGKVFSRAGGNLAGYAAQTFLNQLFQGPAGTITCQHGQIVNMYICVSVSVRNFFIVHF